MGHVLLVEQKRSSSKLTPNQRAILKSLGLKGRGSKIVRKDLRATRGMLNHLQHIISVERLDQTEVEGKMKSVLAKGSGIKILGKGANS
jgi:ribosomal protein L30